MNRLKSIFISGFLMMELTFLMIEISQLISDDKKLFPGLSAAISLLILFLFARLFIFKTPRTTLNFPILTSILFLLFTGFLGLSLLTGIFSFDLLIYNAFSVTGWVVYLRWYSVFPDRSSTTIRVGEMLPELDFENTDGERVSTNDFCGSKIIYLFYRGNWCPLCMAQIKEIATQYQELENRGVKIALVSPQPLGHTKSLSKKFKVPFIFLRDVDHESAKRLNIFQKSGTPLGMEMFGYESDTVMPTVIMSDESGKVIFADLTDNYRIRPEPETFLKVLDSI